MLVVDGAGSVVAAVVGAGVGVAVAVSVGVGVGLSVTTASVGVGLGTGASIVSAANAAPVNRSAASPIAAPLTMSVFFCMADRLVHPARN